MSARRPLGPLAAIAVVLLALASIGARGKRAYLDTYEAHTRHLLIYNGFQTAMNLRGTLLEPRMRDAMADERRRLLNASDGDHAAFVTRMRDDGSAFHEVVFSADSGIRGFSERFGEGDATWNVHLLADGTEEPLVAIERVRKPTPMHQGLYPHVNKWSKLWIARFERTVASPRRIELRVGSGFGHGSLAWDLPASRSRSRSGL